ncbi:RING-H2 zinc finger protein [Melia azedarach]|uniref:RING-H2 zinc finger protein n=1 Tax=Melia azedarach TaxID=155640 RepID=A0ACC1XD52_MELAZ|nr:RING-H2 zinc finger protein [Melia azedarach]
MPPLHHGYHHQQYDQRHDAPSSPKPNPKILSLLLKAIIMTLITSLFFLLLGLASLLLLPLLFTSLHRHHQQKSDLSDGFSPKGLKKLPQFKFSKKIESRLGPEDECVVCLDGFKQGQWCRELVGCGHVFHRKCVDTWLVKVAACPTCRSRVC